MHEEDYITMRSFKRFTIIALAALLLSFGTADAQTAGSAQGIERQVQKKILKLPYYEVFDYINYRVDGDTVTLNGKVRNATNKKSAERAVKDVAGVSRVINNIEVLPLGNFDENIRRSLYASLSRTGSLSRYLWPVNPSVRLIVDRGHVSLEGYVANRGDYNTMNVVAHGVSGAFSVTNNLKIDSGRAN
jgi:osmotically-inducible protein OsmY